jgi:hypothetical protein
MDNFSGPSYDESMTYLKAELAAEPLSFALMAEVRRSAIYVLIGLVLIPLIRWWLREVLPMRGTADLVVGAMIIGLIALFTVGVLSWRLRVDESGLWRRRLLGWDLWPWEAFEQGRVLEGDDPSTSYVCREKPWWARKLSLGLLEPDDREKIVGMIQRVWVRPPAPSLPAELHIRFVFSFGFRKEAFIAPEGLLLRDRGEETRYAWREVRVLRIRRRYRDRQDFESVEIDLSDQTIAFRVSWQHGQAVRSWTGVRGSPAPSPAVLVGVLERYVPSDRVQVTSLCEAPRTVVEWQDRRSILEHQRRDLLGVRWFVCGAIGLLGLLTLFEFYRDGWSGLKFLIISTVTMGLSWAVLRYIERDHWESVTDLEAQVPQVSR